MATFVARGTVKRSNSIFSIWIPVAGQDISSPPFPTIPMTYGAVFSPSSCLSGDSME